MPVGDGGRIDHSELFDGGFNGSCLEAIVVGKSKTNMYRFVPL